MTSTESKDNPLPDVKMVEKTDGDVHLNLVSIDGMNMIPFMVLMDVGPAQRLVDVQNLEVREDDIILATFLKSGTHWVWEILHMLTQGKAEYRKERKSVTMFEVLPNLKMLESEKSPRILNTHLPVRWLPKKHLQNDGKIVHVIRNPKDVAVSMFHHFKSSGEIGRGTKEMTWEQFFDNVVIGELQLYNGWFAYEREMDKAKRKYPNGSIYTIQFEKLKLNAKKEIQKLAEFLNIPCNDSLAEEIADKCSFQNLKTVVKGLPSEFNDKYKELVEKVPEEKRPTRPVIYRKGVVGDWKNYFAVAQNEKFDQIYQREMDGFDFDLLYDPA